MDECVAWDVGFQNQKIPGRPSQKTEIKMVLPWWQAGERCGFLWHLCTCREMDCCEIIADLNGSIGIDHETSWSHCSLCACRHWQTTWLFSNDTRWTGERCIPVSSWPVNGMARTRKTSRFQHRHEQGARGMTQIDSSLNHVWLSPTPSSVEQRKLTMMKGLDKEQNWVVCLLCVICIEFVWLSESKFACFNPTDVLENQNHEGKLKMSWLEDDWCSGLCGNELMSKSTTFWAHDLSGTKN